MYFSGFTLGMFCLWENIQTHSFTNTNTLFSIAFWLLGEIFCVLMLLLSLFYFHYKKYHCIQLYICEDNVFLLIFQLFFNFFLISFYPLSPNFHVRGTGGSCFLYILLGRGKGDVVDEWEG
jgi:hypothetical protein